MKKFAETTHFATIPEWLFRDQTISGNAIKMYAILDRYDQQNGEAFPSLSTLAEWFGSSEGTCRRAIRELEDHGAVVREERQRSDGSQTSNLYSLRREPPESNIEGAPATDDTRPPVRSARSRKERSSLEGEKGSSKDDPSAEIVSVPPPIPKVGGQNEPLNALMEECGVDAGNRQRVKWAVAALNGRAGEQGIRDLFWLEAERWARDNDRLDVLVELRADPIDYSARLTLAIRRKAAKYRETMDGARLTPTALRNWWLDLENTRPAPKRGGGLSAEELWDIARG